MEIADIKAKSKGKQSFAEPEPIFEDQVSPVVTVKALDEPKRYLDIDRSSSDGELKIKLYLPPYDVEDVQ